jgi:hypothetical protein
MKHEAPPLRGEKKECPKFFTLYTSYCIVFCYARLRLNLHGSLPSCEGGLYEEHVAKKPLKGGHL